MDPQVKNHLDLKGHSEPPPMRVLKVTFLTPIGLTNPGHVARYNCLNECIVVATRYYDEELLACLGMLDDIRWLFARGGMGHLTEIKKHTYQNLALDFLSTLYVEVSRGPQCQAWYISFYLQGQL